MSCEQTVHASVIAQACNVSMRMSSCVLAEMHACMHLKAAYMFIPVLSRQQTYMQAYLSKLGARALQGAVLAVRRRRAWASVKGSHSKPGQPLVWTRRRSRRRAGCACGRQRGQLLSPDLQRWTCGALQKQVRIILIMAAWPARVTGQRLG